MKLTVVKNNRTFTFGTDKFRLIIGVNNNRLQGEDFAITPYLSLIYNTKKCNVVVIGLAFTWMWWSLGFGCGWGK